jgi:hypothetical protein
MASSAIAGTPPLTARGERAARGYLVPVRARELGVAVDVDLLDAEPPLGRHRFHDLGHLVTQAAVPPPVQGELHRG